MYTPGKASATSSHSAILNRDAACFARRSKNLFGSTDDPVASRGVASPGCSTHTPIPICSTAHNKRKKPTSMRLW